ncbi:hypothetical protein BKA62DRAFT_158955 [Auriculariales sp. MPI-PUGE-AT-0066]|nr:hypothetical protein BKA62DRAFT_158955 [Auriculariales sp. MPI-PUGE-AT-0066]
MTQNSTDSWFESVRERTQNYFYEDSTVLLQVESKQFRVSRRKLTTASPVFESMFSLPKIDEGPTVLHHKAEDFERFLWYLHADYFEFNEYLDKCPTDQRIRCASSIASLAHFYESSSISTWALTELTSLLSKSNLQDKDTLTRIYVFASDANAQLLSLLKVHWHRQLDCSSDPVIWLVAARDVGDQELQAYAYFYILRKTNLEIRQDPRLSTLDRLRLTTGTVNLLRFQQNECGCSDPYSNGHNCEALTDPDQWSPQPTAPLDTSYEGVSLWEMFTKSPMGFDLIDGAGHADGCMVLGSSSTSV